ncbi:hypothetical protein CY35_05G148000 [Sphagnum magellanicum]|nr:hypothetical protein CY35_05G148000 [Sphagnum magellanicum]
MQYMVVSTHHAVPRNITHVVALLIIWVTTFVLGVVFNMSGGLMRSVVAAEGHDREDPRLESESKKMIFETQEMKLQFTADLRKVIQKFQMINVEAGGAEEQKVSDEVSEYCHAQLHAAFAAVDRLEAAQDLSRANQAEALKLVDSAQQSVSNCRQSLILSASHHPNTVHHNTNDTGGDEDYADNWTSSTPVLLQIQAARNYLYWLANHESDNNTSWKYNHNSHSMPAADAAAGSQCKTCIFPPHALNPCLSGVTGGGGGSHGKSYVVVSDEDNVKNPPQGSLRYGVNLGGGSSSGSGAGGVWITFARDMIIVLKDMLWIRSATTIDGRGYNVTITSKCIVLSGVSNVILHNFQVNGVGESDTVHIFADSSRVWVDHLTSFDAKLGLVSVLQGSTDVTISNSDLMNSNFNMLLGASDADKQDQNMRVTIFRNWFKDSMQRMPHCRWGKCHVINNLYTNWGYYALGARVHAKIISESNVFVPSRRMEVTPWFKGAGPDFDQSASIISLNDLLTNGSTFHQSLVYNPSMSMHPSYPPTARYPPITPTSQLSSLVKTCSGALFGPKLKLCLSHSRIN